MVEVISRREFRLEHPYRHLDWLRLFVPNLNGVFLFMQQNRLGFFCYEEVRGLIHYRKGACSPLSVTFLLPGLSGAGLKRLPGGSSCKLLRERYTWRVVQGVDCCVQGRWEDVLAYMYEHKLFPMGEEDVAVLDRALVSDVVQVWLRGYMYGLREYPF